MSYGYVCRECVFHNGMCDGLMDENGHCDLKTTKRDVRARRKQLVRAAIGNLMLIAGFVVACVAFCVIVEANHARECDGPTTGKCGWAWCKYYDGSDYLHDCN